LKFICKTTIPQINKGWKKGFCEDTEELHKRVLQPVEKSGIRQTIKSTAAIKFEVVSQKNSSKQTDDNICKPISVFMEVVAVLPELTLDKSVLNFWECMLNQRKSITLRITNKNEDLPLDFKFNKVK